MESDQCLFGLVPTSVVESLKQIGQWLARAKAMDDLQTCIRTAEIIPEQHLKDLIGFVASLVRDPNFKISISAMHLLSHMVHRAKTSILQHLSSIITPLIDKLMDSKVLVRQTANLVFRALLEEVGPQAVLPKLTPHTSHFAWRVREELVNVHITAMLIMPPSSFDWPSTAGFLHASLDDAKERVRVATLEAFAVLASKVSESRLANILMAIDCSPVVQNRIKERAQAPQLPSVSDEGLVHHVIDLDLLSGNGTSTPSLPRTPSSSYGRLPFGIPTPGSRRGSSSEDQPAPPSFDPLETTPTGSSSVPHISQPIRPRRRVPEAAFPKLQPLSADPLTWSFSNTQPSPQAAPQPPPQPLLRANTTSIHTHTGRQTHENFDLEQLSLVDMVSSCKLKAKANAAAASNSLHSTSSGRISTGAVITTATPAPKAAKWVPDSREVRVRHSIGSYAMRHQNTRKSQDDTSGLQPLVSRRQHAASEGSRNCSAHVSKLEATGSAVTTEFSLALDTACSNGSGDLSRFTSAMSGVAGTSAACEPDHVSERSTHLLRQPIAQLATGSTLCSAASTASSQEPWLPPVQGMGMHAMSMRESLQSGTSAAGIGGPHTRMGPGGNLMQLNSAPSSDADSALLHLSSSPNSPNKADRLRHLKQVQMHRRAQSAGQPVSDEQLLSSSSHLRRSSSAVRPFLEPIIASSVDMLTRTASSSVSPGVSPTRMPRHLNDVSSASFGASGGLQQCSGGGTAVPGQLCMPAKPGGGAEKAGGGTKTPPPIERLPTASSAAASETNSMIQRAGSAAFSAAPELNLDDSVPSRNPESDLESALEIILLSNVAKRQELDWMRQNEAIDTMRLLVRHHTPVVQGCIKEVLEAMLPCAGALRSSTLKNTLCFFQEIFERLGSRLSSEIEEVVPPLMRKAAEVSTAGRENFLTQYADAALTQMVLSCSEVQCTKALLSMLKENRPSVRLKVAAHLDELLCKSKGGACRSKALQMQLAKAVVVLLDEGSSDTRNHGKRILWSLKRLLPPSQFGALRVQHMEGAIARRVSDALDSACGPPDAPTRLAQSYMLVAGHTKSMSYCQKAGISLPSGRGLAGEEDDANRANTDGVWGESQVPGNLSFKQNAPVNGAGKLLGSGGRNRLAHQHSR